MRAALRSAAVLALGLAACLQGPWDYYPDNPPPFRGVFATAYVLAGKPLTQICFERVLDLGEEHTQAFAWYDSAEVSVSGPFSGQSRAVALSAIADTPNCFRGDTALRAERGGVYALEARFTWDSAGTRVHSLVKGEAHVPDSFSIHRTAAAPSFAKTGGLPENIFDLGFVAQLPPAVRDTILAEYGDSLGRFRSDTAGLGGYLQRRGKDIQKRLGELLKRDQFVYHEGDTLFYLNGPLLNTASHYFSSDRSPDVGCVLITQRFDPKGGRPETAFDSPLGFQPDSDEFYFPGDIRRLLLYPNAVGGNGWNLLDSIGVVNVWLHTLGNRFYFYGFEKAYYDYHTTATQTQGGGGGEGGDPRVKPKYNVTGGQGIFVGGVPDSFDLYIKADSLTKVYPLPATRAFTCNKEGWSSSRDCREYYPDYCREQAWQPGICGADAVRRCAYPAADRDSALGALCDSVADPARVPAPLARLGETQYCIENAFPSGSVCDAPRADCLETKGWTLCKEGYWNHCLDRQWRPEETCLPALASYCHDKPRLSETLCRHADAWCAAHADSPLCK
jgi:hypothetical protein